MARNRSLQLYATKHDFETLFDIVEAIQPLYYARTGLRCEPTALTFASGKDLPDLGFSGGAGAGSDASYLVGYTAAFESRLITQREGGVLYAFDQLNNPNTIVLRPGGRYLDACLIAGQIGSTSTENVSEKLYDTFSKNLRKQFARVRAYWVGPEAMSEWRKGLRLTIGVNSSSAYDLTA
jgi:hypothetical protein